MKFKIKLKNWMNVICNIWAMNKTTVIGPYKIFTLVNSNLAYGLCTKMIIQIQEMTKNVWSDFTKNHNKHCSFCILTTGIWSDKAFLLSLYHKSILEALKNDYLDQYMEGFWLDGKCIVFFLLFGSWLNISIPCGGLDISVVYVKMSMFLLLTHFDLIIGYSIFHIFQLVQLFSYLHDCWYLTQLHVMLENLRQYSNNDCAQNKWHQIKQRGIWQHMIYCNLMLNFVLAKLRASLITL